jgi:hypothetical protein
MSRIIAILTIIGMAFGVFFYLDSNYAKCAEVKAIERRLDYKIESDKLTTTQGRLWRMEDRYGADPDKIQDKDVRQQMKELKVDIDVQKERVKHLEGK